MHSWTCGPYSLPLGAKTYIMGILNVTPDSFSGDGTAPGAALGRAYRLIEDGADILDIGGESTRPGATPVSAEEELNRVVPVISALANQGVPLSIDTTKALVAREAVAAGACIVNDISGATFDPEMLETIAPLSCGVVLMHIREHFTKMRASQRTEGESTDIISEVQDFWLARIAAANRSGIADERIALDAGFGFGKSVEENLDLIRRGRELAALGYPTLSGTSRKSTIGKLLNDRPVADRLYGSAAAIALTIAYGADIVRVHDVKEIKDVVQVADAIIRSK